MDTESRQANALASFAAAGIELQNSKPDSGPRHWFDGPSSPTIKGVEELEMVAYYVEQATDVSSTASDTGGHRGPPRLYVTGFSPLRMDKGTLSFVINTDLEGDFHVTVDKALVTDLALAMIHAAVEKATGK